MAFLQALLCFGFVSLMVIIFYKRRTLRFFYLASKIRGPSLWELVTVHTRGLLAQMATKLCELCELYCNQPYGLWAMTGDFVVVLSSVESISEVYKSKNLQTKPDFFYRAMGDYLGEGSFALSGEKWKTHRKVVSPAFHKAVLESNIDILTRSGENIANEFNKHSGNSGFDMKYIIHVELVDVAVRFHSSNRKVIPDAAKNASAISSAAKFMNNKAINPVKHWFQQRFDRQTKTVETEIRSLLKEFADLLEETPDEFVSDLNSRTDKQNRDLFECVVKSNALTKEGILGECVTVNVAAVDTTKTAIEAAILLLALHQEAQQRVFDELQTIFESSDQRPTPDDLKKMEYLGMVIKETLRLFPSAPFIIRQVLDDTEISGITIPKGACVVVNIMALHRNPDNFKDPLIFDPERFLPEYSVNRDPYSYIPFSYGMRNCVGQTQAVMMLKIILSSIFRRYQVFPGEGINNVNDIQIGFHVTLEVKNPVVKVISRV